MKTLILVRHAKAEERTDSLTQDAKRKLTPKGIMDAELLGKRLFSMQIKPDMIISSYAQRAKQTAQIIAEKIHFENRKIKMDKEVYVSSAASLMKIVGRANDEIQSLMLVGHNPSFNELLLNLCKTNIENIPKGGMAGIRLPIANWKKISAQCGTLLFFDSPKNK